LLDLVVADPIVCLWFQHLLKSLLLMLSIDALDCIKFTFQLPVTSDKSVDFGIAYYFVRLRLQHLLKAVQRLHSFNAPHWMKFSFQLSVNSEQSLISLLQITLSDWDFSVCWSHSRRQLPHLI
jgi:hypothetical protein